ncbi:HlyD family type I secretion periplasmic adaptor subunit [Bacillus sp. FSL H8-0547]
MFKKKIEYEFLPPALEIEEKPTSPLGRVFIWFIFLLLIFLVAWSYVGKIDIVTTARGTVVPNGNVKQIKSLNSGTVLTDLVIKEGDEVKKGQTLIQLDNTSAKADQTNIIRQLTVTRLEMKLLQEELDGKSFSVEEEYKKVLDDPTIRLLSELRTSNKEQQDIRLQALNITVSQKESQLERAREIKNRLDERLDELKIEEAEKKKQYEAEEISEMEWESKKDALRNSEDQVIQQEYMIKEAELALDEAKNTVKNLKEEYEKDLLSQMNEKERLISQLTQEEVKFTKELALATIISPVDGYISELAQLTSGSVITPNEKIMSIIPKGTELIIEAEIQNKDIGFIEKNQKVFVKMDTYPFQKYGQINGTVLYISPDSFKNNKKEPYFKVLVKLDKNQLEKNGEKYLIMPGMTASVDVKTGKRRILDFFIDPIKKHLVESINVR